MDQFDFLYPGNPLLTACLLFGLMLLATEAGVQFGARARARSREEATAYIDFIQGGVLGLLSLLLGFTYALAADRHDARTGLQVSEANAIDTAYMRAGLVSDPSRSELRLILRQYVDAATQFGEVVDDRVKVSEKLPGAERAMQNLWLVGVRSIEGREPTEADSLLLQSLNDVINLHEQRIAAFEYRVPKVILLLLYFLAIASLALTGYGIGLNGSRKFFLTSGVAILVAAVLMVIIDLQHPQQGFIRVSQKSMIRLHDRLQAEKATEATPKPPSVPNSDATR
jgi:hypothetical protein